MELIVLAATVFLIAYAATLEKSCVEKGLNIKQSFIFGSKRSAALCVLTFLAGLVYRLQGHAAFELKQLFLLALWLVFISFAIGVFCAWEVYNERRIKDNK